MAPRTRRARPGLALAVSAALQPAAQAAETLGCFLYDYRLEAEPLTSGPAAVPNVLDKNACQGQCAASPECETFVYSKSQKTCWLGGKATKLERSHGLVTGPKVCPQVPGVCTDMPGASFPGPTVADTFNAWPSGMQPVGMQCWPRGSDDKPTLCEAQPPTILDDMKTTKWPAKCTGMVQKKEPKDGTCGGDCRGNLFCPAFQTEMVGMPQPWIKCTQGMGHDCNATYSPNRNLRVLSAQRVMHGSYRVLKEMTDITVHGLVNAFPPSPPETIQAAVQECNKTCLSVITCEIWQYSKKYGCYVNAPAYHHENKDVRYPALLGPGWYTDGRFLPTVVAGQYIQRYCGAKPVATGISAKLINWATTTTTTMVAQAPAIPAVAAAAAAALPATAASVAAAPPPQQAAGGLGYVGYAEDRDVAAQLDKMMGLPVEAPGSNQQATAKWPAAAPAQVKQALGMDALVKGGEIDQRGALAGSRGSIGGLVVGFATLTAVGALASVVARTLRARQAAYGHVGSEEQNSHVVQLDLSENFA